MFFCSDLCALNEVTASFRSSQEKKMLKDGARAKRSLMHVSDGKVSIKEEVPLTKPDVMDMVHTRIGVALTVSRCRPPLMEEFVEVAPVSPHERDQENCAEEVMEFPVPLMKDEGGHREGASALASGARS